MAQTHHACLGPRDHFKPRRETTPCWKQYSRTTPSGPRANHQDPGAWRTWTTSAAMSCKVPFPVSLALPSRVREPRGTARRLTRSSLPDATARTAYNQAEARDEGAPGHSARLKAQHPRGGARVRRASRGAAARAHGVSVRTPWVFLCPLPVAWMRTSLVRGCGTHGHVRHERAPTNCTCFDARALLPVSVTRHHGFAQKSPE